MTELIGTMCTDMLPMLTYAEYFPLHRRWDAPMSLSSRTCEPSLRDGDSVFVQRLVPLYDRSNLQE